MLQPFDPRFCNCCTPGVTPAPVVVYNRPGLAAIGYRIGTFARFREAMLAQIHRYPELLGLATREPDDHAITFLDLAAAIGDLLTFYNERIANEMYLGQALHPESVEQLVSLLGYRPRPALAATGTLAFAIQPALRLRLGRGLQVMSIPAAGETAQIVETLEAIDTTGRLSAALAFAPFTPINALAQGSGRAPLVDPPDLVPGARLVLFGGPSLEEKTVRGLAHAPGGHYLRFDPPVQATGLDPRFVRALPLRRRLRFFGHDAPLSHMVYDPSKTTPPQQRWEALEIEGAFVAATQTYPLDGLLDDLEPGAHLLLDAGPGPDAMPRLRTARVVTADDRPASLEPLADTVTHVALRQTTVTHVTLCQTIAGRPTIMMLPGGVDWIFARTGAGHAAVLSPFDMVSPDVPRSLHTLGSPHTPASPPLVASSDLAPLFVNALRLDVFFRNERLQLVQFVLSIAGAAVLVHGGRLGSAPVPLLLAGGEVRVFARGEDGRLLVFDATLEVGEPLVLDGSIASAPSAVSPDGSSIRVFARRADNALWERRFDGVAWADWQRLGGEIAGNPVAVMGADGWLEVYARGAAGGILLYRETVGGWRPIRPLGGDAAGDPAVVVLPQGWSVIAVRTTEGRLAFAFRLGEAVSGWLDQGGSLASDPSLAIDNSSGFPRFLVTARHTDDTIATSHLTFETAVWDRHGLGLGAIPDRRAARLYEIEDVELAFRGFDYPERAVGSTIGLPLEPGEDPDAEAGLGPLLEGRRVVIEGPDGWHAATVTRRRAVASEPGGVPDHLEIAIDPPLPPTAGPLRLHGNIATASHGETQREAALGNGDARRPFQRFTVPPGEITHLPTTTGTRPEPEVELRVDGVRWAAVPHLFGRSPKARVFALETPSDGPPVIMSGDGGRGGARLPTGALNIRLTRRLGAGLAGNLRAGQAAMALDKPAGLVEVTNPLPFSGGAPGESAGDARRAAPRTMQTFGRIVSLDDFVSLATASGLAARAHATWVWSRLERTPHLTVAGPGGAPLSPASLALLHQQLGASRQPHRPLLLANMVRVPIVLAARLLADPAHEAATVLAGAAAAIDRAFAFETLALGAAVHLSNVFAMLQTVPGVAAVAVDRLQLRDHDDLEPAERAVRSVTAAPVQVHIRLYPARPTPDDPSLIDRYQRAAFAPGPPPAVLPAEQAWIQEPAEDVQLSIVEAL